MNLFCLINQKKKKEWHSMELKGKTAVITGGTSGMGEATVQLFVKEGANVVFTGTDSEKGKRVADEAAKLNAPGRAVFLKSDVSNEEDVKALVEFVNREFDDCDILVNNAGIFIGGQLHETDSRSWDKLMDVDLKGVYLTSRHFLPQMLKNRRGVIINNSSVSGLNGEYNMAAYSAAKGAVCNLTRSMALDYADKGIRVNAVCPGATRTPMFMTGSTAEVLDAFNKVFPPRRVGEPVEVAQVIMFLASDRASFLNGLNLPIDGGITAHTGQPRQDKEE
jgi:meso-butanediol dehydrogenase/(S,S)-butanediol dehydrogenase/diacetyl reductase